MVEDHGAPKCGKLPRARTTGSRERVAKKQAARVSGWAVDGEVRGVPGRMTAGAA